MAIISRNYVRTPRFPSLTDKGKWGTIGTLTDLSADGETTGGYVELASRAGANPIDGTEGNRAICTSSSRPAMGVFLPDLDVAAGDTVRVTVTYTMAVTGMAVGLGLGWEGSTTVVGASTYDYYNVTDPPVQSLSTTTGYEAFTYDLTVPEVDGLQYKASGAPQTVPAGTIPRWYLAFIKQGGAWTSLGVSGARVDVVTNEVTYVPGYADGSMGVVEDITYSWAGTPFESVTEIEQAGVGPEPIAPPVATFTEDPPRFALPDTPNVTWSVNGEIKAAGEYGVTPTVEGFTVSIFPIAADGFEFVPPAETQEHTWYVVPEPDPTPNPWPEGITEGGKLVARWLKMTSDSDKEECSFYYDVALHYVWGYTKGKGFDDDMVPAMPLQRVIVAGAARIAYNPESVHRWQISSESEYLTVFNGFNLAEQGILNRYRVRWA